MTDGDKQQLLNHLKASTAWDGERKKITLTKRSTSEIKQADATGKARTIQVEVRKKRTFIQREDPAEVAAPAGPGGAGGRGTKSWCAARKRYGSKSETLPSRRRSWPQERKEREERQERERKDARPKSVPAPTLQLKPPSCAKKKKPRRKPLPRLLPPPRSASKRRKQRACRPSRKPRPAPAKRPSAPRTWRDRRRKALAEAEAIRAMMAAPKKVLVAKKPEKAEETEEAASRCATAAAGAKKAAPAKPGDKAGAVRGSRGAGKDAKEVKSAKLSSSWANDDSAKKKEIKTRGDSSGGVGQAVAATGARGGPKVAVVVDRWRNDRQQQQQQQEFRALEISVPETITVAELAHKMAVKASELIKVLMKMGQMVTINQPLDQDTAMIVVEEMGHTAKIAALDDPEAFSEEDATQ